MSNYKNFQLANALIRGKWAIDPMTAISSLDFVESIIQGKREVEPISDKPFSRKISAEYPSAISHHYFSDAPKGSVAYIPIMGTLMKNDQMCGPDGMSTIASYVKEAGANENIGSIFLHVDSPGGTVDGTEQLARAIRAVGKPVVTFVDGMMASAALWIGSGADEIYASTEYDEIGSVGVLLSYMDMIGKYEKEGATFHHIVSNLSPDKVKMFTEIREGKYENYQKNVLDPLAEKFQSMVRENLPETKDEQLTGRVYFAKDMVGVWVNAIKTIDEAFDRAGELANDYINDESNNQYSNNHKNSQEMPKFNRIGALIGNDTFEATEEGIHMSEDNLQTVEDHLEQQESVSGELETAQNTITEHEATIQQRDERITELESQVANLQGSNIPPKPIETKPAAPAEEESFFDTMAKAKETFDALEDLD